MSQFHLCAIFDEILDFSCFLSSINLYLKLLLPCAKLCDFHRRSSRWLSKPVLPFKTRVLTTLIYLINVSPKQYKITPRQAAPPRPKLSWNRAAGKLDIYSSLYDAGFLNGAVRGSYWQQISFTGWWLRKCCGTAVGWGYGGFKFQLGGMERPSQGVAVIKCRELFSLVTSNFRPPGQVAGRLPDTA